MPPRARKAKRKAKKKEKEVLDGATRREPKVSDSERKDQVTLPPIAAVDEKKALPTSSEEGMVYGHVAYPNNYSVEIEHAKQEEVQGYLGRALKLEPENKFTQALSAVYRDVKIYSCIPGPDGDLKVPGTTTRPLDLDVINKVGVLWLLYDVKGPVVMTSLDIIKSDKVQEIATSVGLADPMTTAKAMGIDIDAIIRGIGSGRGRKGFRMKAREIGHSR